MNPLVEQLPPARKRRLRTPFGFVPEAATMAIGAADKKWAANCALFEQLACAADCTMIAVIVASFQDDILLLRCPHNCLQFRRACSTWLFCQNMLSCLRRQKAYLWR